MIIRTRMIFVIIFLFFLDLAQMKPQENLNGDQKGPCIGMDCLHGVLMHNDGDQGEKHIAEDQYLRFKGVLDTEKPRDGPLDAESQLHGILMHGEGDAKDHHLVNEQVLPEKVADVGPKDLSDMIHEGMHGEEGTHTKHKWNSHESSEQSGVKGPVGGEEFMHNVLMHGDINFEHKESPENKGDADKKPGPQDAETQFHGVMMHGDSDTGKEHKHHAVKDTNKDVKKNIGPNNDLHGILMHGDSEVGHAHVHGDTDTDNEAFSDITQIKDLGLDESLLKMIDIEKLIEKDRKEYANWIINNPQFQDESMMGSTMASVSDTLLDDIELMKKRYLAQANQRKDNEKPKPHKQDDHPFTAEDAKAVYDENIHATEGEDARHDLELLGSTEPINARHRAKLELLKSKIDK